MSNLQRDDHAGDWAHRWCASVSNSDGVDCAGTRILIASISVFCLVDVVVILQHAIICS